MHSPSGAACPQASCIYIKQSTLACVITYTYTLMYKIMKVYAKSMLYMGLLATGNSYCCLHVLYGDVCLKRSYRSTE